MKIKNMMLALSLLWGGMAAQAQTGAQPQQSAPDFTLRDIRGQEVSLSKLREGGHAVVLDFWGTGCIKRLPEMKRILQRTAQKVEMVSIYCNDTEEAWRKMVEEKGMYWWQLRNEPGQRNVVQLYGIQSYPTKIIISPDGKILGRFEGEAPEFYAMLDSLYAPKLPEVYDKTAITNYLTSYAEFPDSMRAASDYYQALYAASNKLLKQKGWSEQANADMAIDAIAMVTTEDPRPVLDYYLAHSTDATLQSQVRKAYDEQVAQYGMLYPGHEAPDFTFTDRAGKKLSLKNLRGKTVLIDIWGTWCVPCIEEMPNLDKLQQRYKDRSDVAIVSVACDKKREKWTAFLDKHQPSWTQYLITPEGDKVLNEVYRTIGIPRFIIIDRQGRIVTADSMRPSDPEFDAYFEHIAR